MTQSPTEKALLQRTAKRRWFRYSLRTLLAVLTVGCLWLGWNVNIVQQRQAMLKEIETSGGRFWTDDAYWEIQGTRFDGRTMVKVVDYRNDPTLLARRLPTWRYWLGDAPIYLIDCRDSGMRVQADRARKLFPEAQVWPEGAEPFLKYR
jgi:hypothetical protein